MSDPATLEAAMRGPIQRTTWISREPCPRFSDKLATNGTGAAWCIRQGWGYARQVKRRKK